MMLTAVTPPAWSSVPSHPKPPVVSSNADQNNGSTAVIAVVVQSPQPVTNDEPKKEVQHGAQVQDRVPDPCFYLVKSSAEAVAGGYDPSKGTLSTAKCPVRSSLPGLPDGVRYVTHDVWTPTGQAPVAPPPDPAVLAQSAASQLTVPAPVVHVGAGEPVAVKVPVWLWVDQQPALTATVSAGGVTVTARAVLTSTDWSMGDPVSDPDDGGAGKVPSFSCSGAGTAPPARVARSVVPPCGYTYIWRSDAARTGGSGAWTMTVVARWTMSWQATNGAQGTIALQAASTTQVQVGEWRVALVSGG